MKPATSPDPGAEPQPARILLGISTTDAASNRRRAIRETWLGEDQAEHVFYSFFTIRGSPDCDEPDLVVLDAPAEEEPHAKVFRFARWALETLAFDWLLVCDDSCYLDLGRLTDLVAAGPDAVGQLAPAGCFSRETVCLLPRSGVESLAGGKGSQPVDDGHITDRASGRQRATAASLEAWFSPAPGRFPNAGNDVVACAGCEDWKMRQIHRLRSARHVVEVQVEHPHWTDAIMLSSDGYFCRANAECDGRWAASEHGVINLVWSRWGDEYLVPFGERKGAGPLRYLCTREPVRTLTVLVHGGLGNQMFQYAHGLALARRLTAVLRVVSVACERPYGLDRFDIPRQGSCPGDADRFEDHEGRQLERDWPSFSYFTRSGAKHFLLGGGFQNENYFLPVAREIREIFKVIPLRPAGTEDGNLVVIHVRRGDFAGSPVHDLCKPRFYRQAIEMMRTLVRDPVFMVVSDDPGWCQENFTDIGDIRFWPKHQDSEDMAVMASADALILSNSTFAWWAAWLGKGGPVIAPDPYVSGRPWEIVPSRWIRLPASGVPPVL